MTEPVIVIVKLSIPGPTMFSGFADAIVTAYAGQSAVPSPAITLMVSPAEAKAIQSFTSV